MRERGVKVVQTISRLRGRRARHRCAWGRPGGGAESKGVGAVAALAGGGASRRWPRPLCDRLGFRTVGGVLGGSGEPRAWRPGPHLLFMALCDGGPPTILGLGAPDQGADPKAQLAGGDQLTFSPFISLIT